MVGTRRSKRRTSTSSQDRDQDAMDTFVIKLAEALSKREKRLWQVNNSLQDLLLLWSVAIEVIEFLPLTRKVQQGTSSSF